MNACASNGGGHGAGNSTFLRADRFDEKRGVGWYWQRIIGTSKECGADSSGSGDF